MRTRTAQTPAELATQILDELLTQRARIDHQIREALRIIDTTTPTGRRSRRVIPECGSETAYQRHRHFRDTATDDRRVTCEPCLEAHRLHARIQYARKNHGDDAAEYVEKRARPVGSARDLSVTTPAKRDTQPDHSDPHAMNNDDTKGAA